MFAFLAGLAGTGCALDEAQPEGEHLGTVKEELSGFLTTPRNYYYTSGGVTWFQDDYSGKWCTGAVAQAGVYDYSTTCSSYWVGWRDSSYHQYCDDKGAFWQNAYYHYHCP